jgi:hypothetical protein
LIKFIRGNQKAPNSETGSNSLFQAHLWIGIYWFSLKLVITDPVSQVLNESKIQPLKGQALKTNEDALDAIVCTAGGSINQ